MKRASPLAWIERGVAALLGLTIFAMMAVTTVDVVFRYFIDAPLKGAFEIVTLLFATSAFLALPLVTRSGEHIVVDLLEPLLRPPWLRVQRLLVSAIGAAVFMAMAVQLWRHAGLLAAGGRITGFLEWPLAPVVYFMSIMSAATALVYLALIGTQLRSGEMPAIGQPVSSNGGTVAPNDDERSGL
jgi:TRAP-type C4-dicarboxylate transport system permease small subunit